MKTKVFTYLLITFSLTTFGQSNNIDASSKANIKTNFSFQAIKGFQESAVFKIEDYYDYLELYANESTSDTLQLQVKEAIYNLFIESQPKVLDFTSSENKSIPLNKLLDK